MRASETVSTEHFARLTGLDLLRWIFALTIVAGMGAGSLSFIQNLVPPPNDVALAADPPILLELQPIPEPEIAPPEPTPEPAEPTPAPAEAEPEPLPQPPVLEPEPMLAETPPEPVVEPPPPDVSRADPEPIVQPDPSPEDPADEPPPVQEEPEIADPNLPMPVTMSAALQEQRKATPATKPHVQRPTPQPTPPPQQAEAPRPSPKQPAPQVSQPAVAAGPSPTEWQAQVLHHVDRRKVYPRDAQRAGEEGVVAIAFTIDQSGRVLSASIARSSGYPALDQAALETARRASPLPKPPTSLGNSVTLTASIRFSIR